MNNEILFLILTCLIIYNICNNKNNEGFSIKQYTRTLYRKIRRFFKKK